MSYFFVVCPKSSIGKLIVVKRNQIYVTESRYLSSKSYCDFYFFPVMVISCSFSIVGIDWAPFPGLSHSSATSPPNWESQVKEGTKPIQTYNCKDSNSSAVLSLIPPISLVSPPRMEPRAAMMEKKLGKENASEPKAKSPPHHHLDYWVNCCMWD